MQNKGQGTRNKGQGTRDKEQDGKDTGGESDQQMLVSCPLSLALVSCPCLLFLVLTAQSKIM
jgi:hypothetical protein